MRAHTRRIMLCGLLAALVLSALPAQTIRIRFGSAVPTNSIWDIGMRRLASEWARLSNNQVQIQFQGGLVNSPQDAILRRLSARTLNAALLEIAGLNQLQRDIYYLSMPNVIRSEQEFAAASAVAVSALAAQVDDDFVVLGLAQGGWVYFFSDRPINVPADMAGLRIGVNTDLEILVQTMQLLGGIPVSSTTTSLARQFSSNQIDVTYTSPLYISTIWPNLKTHVTHMSAQRIGPFFGALIINKADWEHVPATLQPPLLAAAQRIIREMGVESITHDAAAIQALRDNGLTITPVSSANQRLWDEFFAGAQAVTMLRSWFSATYMERINQAVDAIRNR
ncbi:MAG TPA: hypothetical protein DD477_02140 [Spirochaetaceae bacterium]|nr:hypothetical protein [Spirochaetaceae bacterium]HAW86714.1 hypothetical protein [Spirochaetaceae bacterium]HAX36346.1 hypothetical protein [Spirochaetaceae bacterium]HBO40003.1 hypothetical protein [Spirochaetaceae bacterium]HCQ88338.1 hypothetical protein [Spirochaetaceae bacterium]